MKHEGNINKPILFLAGIAVVALLFVSFPLMSLLGAADLNVISVFEFYFIDLMTHPLNADLGSTKLSDAFPFKNSFSNFSLLKHILPNSILHYTNPLLKFIGVYFERIDAVLGGVSLFVFNEAVSLFKSLFSTKMFVILLLLFAISISPVKLLLLPFTLVAFSMALVTISVGSMVASVLFNRPLYQYLRLESLLNSIAFSVLTDMAFIYLQATSTIAIGYILYGVTLLPLAYFAHRAYYSEIPNDSGFLAKLGYNIGSISLLMHIIEASYTVLGVMGYRRCREIGLMLNSQPLQATVLATTTTLSMLCIADQVSDEKYAMVPAHNE